MKNRTILLSALLIVISAACTVQVPAAEKKIELVIEPGKNWNSTIRIGFIPIKKPPQIAAWIETEEGDYAATITVTESSSKQKWIGAPEGGRPESLPVWSHAKNSAAANVDAAASATPKTGLIAEQAGDILIPGKRYRILIEVNTSFDYNDTWPKNAKEGEINFSGINGQPSVIYEAYFTAGENSTVILQAAGQGSLDGSNGNIIKNLNGLTTALTIIKSAKLNLR